jgi:hypothetical protein
MMRVTCRTLKKHSFAFALACAALFGGVNATTAGAATCEIPLRNVFVDSGDCAYYVTAFRMMATPSISVDAVCKRGSFKNSQGTQYTAKVSTTLTVQNSNCGGSRPFKLNPVLLSRPHCSNLEQVISMLDTDFVDVKAACQYGTWTGADGGPRTSMVSTSLSLRPRRVAQKLAAVKK